MDTYYTRVCDHPAVDSTTIRCTQCGMEWWRVELERKLNPTVGPKYDQDKLRYDLVPPIATKALAEVLTFGAQKYAPNSWQNVPEGERRYTAALMRHFEAYRAGEELDPETLLSHLSHVLCNAAFLLHFQEQRLKGESC